MGIKTSVHFDKKVHQTFIHVKAPGQRKLFFHTALPTAWATYFYFHRLINKGRMINRMKTVSCRGEVYRILQYISLICLPQLAHFRTHPAL
jgi:hypothetical protein